MVDFISGVNRKKKAIIVRNIQSSQRYIPYLWIKFTALVFMLSACAGLMLYEKKLPHTHNFNHKLHTTQVDLDCVFCHSAVATDGVVTYGMLPKMADCLMCHQQKFDENECSYCHNTAEPGPLKIPVHEHLNYSHEQHASIEGWDKSCLDCHAQAHTVTQAGQKKLPPMQLCLECHQEKFDRLECFTCHNGFDQIPLKPLSQFSHAGNFTETHGPMARTQMQLCLTCHDGPYCTECHRDDNLELPPELKFPDRFTQHTIHEGDFLSRHFIEARFNSSQCITCHSQTFCRDCHVREGIADVNPGSGTDLTANPHPLGFGFRSDPTDPNFHGRIARREIFTCAGCHDNGADTICLECHATVEKGGWGVNPHPAGFRSRLSRTNDRVCLFCHVQ